MLIQINVQSVDTTLYSVGVRLHVSAKVFNHHQA